jgi:hypothetical protein
VRTALQANKDGIRMTIAAAYLTSEGVVLGADSTTTVTQQTDQGASVVQLLNHAQKVFEVGPPGEGRMGVCTWGAGGYGPTSHRSLIARLSDMLNEKTTVQQATDMLVDLVEKELKVLKIAGGVGYFIGGCDLKTRTPACWRLWFEAGKLALKNQLAIGEASFSGAPDFFHRVFFGYDSRLPQLIEEGLRKEASQLDDKFYATLHGIFKGMAGQLTAAGFPDLPLRDAIDFVHTYLHLTIKAHKFRFGPAVCGGPIEIGFVSTDRCFRWVAHKSFDAAFT